MTSSPARLVPHRLSARALAAEVASGSLTSEAIVADCLERIASREETVRAWSFLDPAAAIAQAREIDRGPRRGILHGIPIGIKDVIDTYDMPTEYGSEIYAGFRPAADAGCVAMCRSAGAVILGKTVTAEFATRHPGKTTNPWNAGHTPGGSSSGSAAAVADFMVPVAVGTQTGGSIIRPASYCGVVGLKPSYGLVSRAGVKQISESLDTVGLFTRSVTDAAFFLAAAAGRPDFAEIEALRPARVGLCQEPNWEHASSESRAALSRVADALGQAAVAVTEIAMPPGIGDLSQAWRDIERFEIARSLQHEYRCHRDRLTTYLASQIEQGLECQPSNYENALQIADRYRSVVDALFDTVDLLVTASAPGEAPAGLTSTGSSVFNRTWTLLGLPCLALPIDRGPNDLPVGVQLVGRLRQDAKLLGNARWIENHLVPER